MSRKPEKTDKQDTKKRKLKKKTKRIITRAVTYIGLSEANPGKLEALDRLVAVYLALCQQYIRLLCTQEVTPDKYMSPAFETDLSDRWHRVAIQQAVGIANFVTTSTGKQYGSFHGKLRSRQKRDREKRRRKAQLRACLKKKGVEKLPSTSSASGQHLSRHVRQSINRAVNQMLKDHPNARIIYEDLSVASMRSKAKAMNAYLYASNLAHIPEQLAWATAKRGMAAYTVKALLMRRHDEWMQNNRLAVVQLGLWGDLETSTDLG